MNIIRYIVLSSSLAFSGFVSAELYAPQPRDPFIKDSYIVTFRATEAGRPSVILPPVTRP